MILEEAVAFANAHGGALLLGIKESESKPPTAADISPVPRCAELAERLKLIFPRPRRTAASVLDIIAVPTKDESGVVITRVGRSRNAPHRDKKTLVCPIRRADRCEEMSMREIQDMTLNVSRGLERLDKRLMERSEHFQQEFKRLKTPNDAYGIRMTAASVDNEIWFDRVFHQRTIKVELDRQWHTIVRPSNENRRDFVFDYPGELPPRYWRPILRGARAELDNDYALTGLPYYAYKELHCDGLLEFGFVTSNTQCFPPNWPIVIFLNLAIWAEYVRNQADAPTAEYALEVEICVRGGNIAVRNPSATRPPSEILQSGTTRFPRYSLGDSDEILELLRFFYRDFWNNLGQDYSYDENELIIKAVG